MTDTEVAMIAAGLFNYLETTNQLEKLFIDRYEKIQSSIAIEDSS